MNEFLSQIIATFLAQDLLEYSGLAFGIIYVILAANNKIICWIFGIISCLAIAIKDFYTYNLYADGLLQIFYIIMGFAGLYLWRFGGKTGQEKRISSWTIKKHLPYVASILILSIVLGLAFSTYTDASFPYLDSLTTLMSIYATFLLVNRIIGNWIIWIIADAIYVYLYFFRDAYLFALLMVIYTLIAISGYVKWRIQMNLQAQSI